MHKRFTIARLKHCGLATCLVLAVMSAGSLANAQEVIDATAFGTSTQMGLA